MKNKLLRNGVEMPEVGFGTWKAGETDGFAVLSEAIRAGYRHDRHRLRLPHRGGGGQSGGRLRGGPVGVLHHH